MEALSDPTRREIFERVRRGPTAVSALAAEVPVSRPAVSQHLKVLQDARLVTHRVEGTRHIYRVDPAGLAELRAWIEQLWDESLARFKEHVEKEAQ